MPSPRVLEVAFTVALCEEEFMARVHGPRWAEYASRTWRYLPWVY